MTFEEILDQAIAMLQRRRRVTYRLLQRQFQLDDDPLGDLLAELRYAYGEVISEDEQGMVWTGGAAVFPTPPPPALQPFQPSVSQEAPAPQADGTSTTPSTPDAERRQLTVMFCDLVDSTKLSAQLDPEEYRDVVHAYQRVCSAVVTRFDGYIAQLLGDGLLVYFGYPQAHEDDAQRAVRAGLGILAAMGDLHKRPEPEQGITLALRLGIHTGLVVVGAMGGGGRHEQLALGETPNVAARIQGLAAPNTMAVSEATYRLVQGYFECQDLGAQTLRGVAEPVHVYRVLQESGARGRLDVAVTRGLTPLVGREQEVGLLLERWEQAKSGQGQVVLLTGDAGIGKSRLVQMLKDHVAHEPHTGWECRSSEYYQNTPLYPLTDLFQHILQWQQDETSDEKLIKLEQALSQYRLPLEESIPLLAPLLSLSLPESRDAPLNVSPQRQRQKALETIVAILLELAERQPVLFILEDLHWTDPTTLALLNLLIEQTPTASVLMLLTCRPTFQPTWSHRSYLSEITVNRLSPPQVEQIVNRITDGKTLPTEVLQQIIAKTDGVPLFVEEMTKAILESGHLKEVDGHYELTGAFSTLAIPATLQDSLMARLDRLVTAKAVAQYAAVIGRQFAYDLLSTVSQLDEVTLRRELSRLVEAEIVYQRGMPPQATYIFKHALIQDAAYASLLKSTRQHYHQRIAQVLEAQFPETVEAQPELLAHHYTEAGLPAQAMGYWQQASDRAFQRSAYVEALAHLTHGFALRPTFPDTAERARHELRMQMTRGLALTHTQGHAAPDVGHAYERARILCQQVGDTPQLSATLAGLRRFYLVRAAFQQARDIGEQLLQLAHQQEDVTVVLWGHFGVGAPLFHLAEFSAARVHLEQGIALYDRSLHQTLLARYGTDHGVICRAWLAMVLWHLGYPQQALHWSQEALTLAQDFAHPFSLALAFAFATYVHQFRRDVPNVRRQADALLTLAQAQGFPSHSSQATISQGWARSMEGNGAEGIRQMRDGLDATRTIGIEANRSYYLALLAEAYGRLDYCAPGLQVLTDALASVQKTGERFYEAELHRLKGELLLQRASDSQAEAEACFHQALDIAQRQQAKSWELRAATSLARLWQQQGKRQEAYDLLAPVYHWFTEGFDTADLQDAKVLLEALA